LEKLIKGMHGSMYINNMQKTVAQRVYCTTRSRMGTNKNTKHDVDGKARTCSANKKSKNICMYYNRNKTKQTAKKKKKGQQHIMTLYTNKKSIFSEVKSQTTYHYTPPSILPFAKKYQLLRVLNTNNKKGER